MSFTNRVKNFLYTPMSVPSKEPVGIKTVDKNNTKPFEVFAGIDTRNSIEKVFIPKYLYAPPFGYPRNQDLTTARWIEEHSAQLYMILQTVVREATSTTWEIVVKEDVDNPEDTDRFGMTALYA